MKRLLLLSVLLLHFNFTSRSQSIILDGSFNHNISGVWFGILTVDLYYASDAGNITQEGPVSFADAIGGCVGLRFYSPTDENWQEYIYQNITGAMHSDTTYQVSLKYRLAAVCSTATNFIGVGFLKGYTHKDQITETVLRAKNPEVYQSGQLMDNNLAYRELKQYYTATGDETFFAIGAFQTDDEITRLPVSAIYPGYANNQKGTILYFIDDVKIIPCNDYPPDPLPEELAFCDQELVQLSAPPVTGAQFLWSTGDTTSQISVLANNQDVWLEITKNGCVRSDTVKLRAFSGDFNLGEDRKVCSSEAFPIVLSINKNPNEEILWNTGATGTNFSVNSGGTYWAQKSQGECVARDTISIIDLSSSAHIYPNPVDLHFAIGNGEDARILQIQTEDGKSVFKGEASMESIDLLMETLTPAVYFVTAKINDCILRDKFVKVKL